MKKLISIVLALTAALTFTGCSAQDAVQGVSDAVQAQGRQYGQTYELAQNESMKCQFFTLSMNSATLKDEFAGATPDGEGNKFLVANVTILNSWEGEEAIPMYDTDFELNWEGQEGTIYPVTNYSDEMLPEEYSIDPAGEITGNLVFEVPGDKTDFSFRYLEYYDDDFEGNTYAMSISAA